MGKTWLPALLIPCLAAGALLSCNRRNTAPAPVPAPKIARPAPETYVGTQACSGCHQQRVASFQKTAHALTSREPSRAGISGSFEDGKNVLRTHNPGLWYEMQVRPGGLYQDTMMSRDDWYSRVSSERIDLVTGSGKKGETYLTWKGNGLFELPVSYMVPYGWINSPGYADGLRNGSRPISPTCLNCHATYFRVVSEFANRYERTGYVLGVGCERCHGPGSRHIEYHIAHPQDEHPRHIINPAELSAERQSDLCEQCHSDPGTLLRPAFSYRPGEPLSSFRHEDKSEEEQNQPGAHSTNQPARLHLARCFRESGKMTCTTCHNPHTLERGQLALFSKRCLGCHQKEQCPLSKKLGARIEQNCIDCHMKLVEDRHNIVLSAQGPITSTQRDHFVGIYPEETRRILGR